MAGLDSYVKLLIQSETTDGSTTFVDSSADARTITAYGNVKHSTTWAKFGSSSIKFDGSGDYLVIPTSTDFNLGSGDYTLDLWVNPQATNIYQRVLCRHTGAQGWFIGISNANKITYYNGTNVLVSTTTIVINTPFHVAVVRNGESLKLYVNGVAEASITGPGASVDPAANIQIGRLATQTYYLNGYVEEIRVSIGIARWTANFTPPTEAYSEDATPEGYAELGAKGDITTVAVKAALEAAIVTAISSNTTVGEIVSNVPQDSVSLSVAGELVSTGIKLSESSCDLSSISSTIAEATKIAIDSFVISVIAQLIADPIKGGLGYTDIYGESESISLGIKIGINEAELSAIVDLVIDSFSSNKTEIWYSVSRMTRLFSEESIFNRQYLGSSSIVRTFTETSKLRN